MMKNLSTYFLLVMSAAALSSCGGNAEKNASDRNDSTVAQTGKSDTITFTIEKLDGETYCQAAAAFGYCDTSRHNNDSLTEAELLQKHPGVIKRTGNKLEVITKKGKQTFTDKDSEGDDYQAFRVSEITGRLAILMNVYYESYDYTCIDLETGQSFNTWGTPVVNSAGNRVIAGNNDLVAAFTNNGLQLYTFDGKEWALAMQKILDDWGPEDLLWKNDEEVWCKKMVLDNNMNSRTEYAKVILKQEKMD